MQLAPEDISESQSEIKNHTPNKLKRLKRKRSESSKEVDPDEQLFDMIDADDVKIKKNVKKQQKYARKLLDMFQQFSGRRQSPIKKKVIKQKIKSIEQQKKIDNQPSASNNSQQVEKKPRLLKKVKLDTQTIAIPQESKTKQKQEKNQIDEEFNSVEKKSDGSVSEPEKKSKKKKRKDSQSSFIQNESDYEQESYSEYTQGGKKIRKMRRKKQQIKKRYLEKQKVWQQKYGDAQQKQQKEVYYTGLEFNNNFKRDKNTIKSKNRMFDEFNLAETDLINYADKKDTQKQEKLELDIKPNEIKKGINQYNFLNKALNIKKSRGLISESNTNSNGFNSLGFDSIMQNKSESTQRNKQSLMKLMSTTSFNEDQELQLRVRVPCITRGKSSTLFNNTIFLKKMSFKEEHQVQKLNTEIFRYGEKQLQQKKRKTIDRQQMFRDQSNKVKLNKSRHISHQQIIASFKKTDLNQLQLVKKRNEEQRRKQMNALILDQDDQEYLPPDLQKNSEKQQNVEKDVPVNTNKDDNDNDNNNAVAQPSNTIFQENLNNQQQEIKSNVFEQLQIKNNEQKAQIVKQKKIDDEEYEKLLALQQGQQEEQVQQSQVDEDKIDAEQIQADDQVDQQQQQAQDINQDSQKSNQDDEKKQQQDVNFLNDDQLVQPQHNQKNEELEEYENIEKRLKEKQQQNENPLNNENNKQFFKKLKKIANIISQRKKKKQEFKKRVEGFMEEEAQLGSDNEENDFKKKYIDREGQEKQFEGIDLDADLQQLIDNAVYLNQSDEEQAFQKFLRDQRIREKEELKKIIRGEFRRSKRDLVDLEFDEDEKKKLERMQEILAQNKRLEQQEQGLYVYGNRNGMQQTQENNQKSQPQNEIIMQIQKQLKRIKNPVKFNEQEHFGEANLCKKNSMLSNSSNSLTFFPRNRNSLLNVIADKNRISGFTQQIDRNSKVKSNVNKLYQKGVMASRRVVVFGGLKKTKTQSLL